MLRTERQGFTIRLAVDVETALVTLQDRFCYFSGSREASLRTPRHEHPEIRLSVLHRGRRVVVDLQPFEISQHVGREPLGIVRRPQRRLTDR